LSDGTLPPVGLLPRVDGDTVRVQCEMLSGPPPVLLDTVEIRSWRNKSAVVPLVIDLRFPS
jgi:hypothetical protein